MTTAAEYANGLRELADWIEAHPDIPLPPTYFNNYSMDTKEDAAKCLKALKPCRKEYSGEMFSLSREFGVIKLKFTFYRNAVCTPKVVGTRIIEAHTKPAVFIPAEHIPERTEEIIEWDCHPVLEAPAEMEPAA